jgi:multidrug efflux pump subunit AcrA (membrane-fusion protein)
MPPGTTQESEVSEILSQVPPWVAQGMVYLIAAFVVAGLLIAHFSPVDVTVNARGTLNEKLEAEVKVLNKDIGRMEVGLPARLKIDAYPFQQYGAVPAKVAAIAAKAAGEDAHSYYQVTLAPATSVIPARGRQIALRDGLTLTAEIVTDRKTLLSMLLEPFRGKD